MSLRGLEHLETLVITNQRLGGGHFGSVFVCKLGEGEVAAKKLSQSEKEISNLVNEAARLKRLQHGKHIAYTYGFTTKEEGLYMVMEYCEHGGLQNYLKKNKESVTYEQKILFCRGILLGLLYCHSMKIFHGDIKCSNVILGKNLEPKLTDFGLSVTVDNIAYYKNLCKGSLYWTAPELFSIKEDETVYQEFIANPYPCDVYSLGTTFCEISYDGTTEFIASTDEPDMDIMLGNIYPIPKDAFLQEIVDECCQFERNERISLDKCLSMLDAVAEKQLPTPAADDKWLGIQQDIKANSKLELPPSFILHRPVENLVVGPSNLSLLEWLCINNCTEAVEYMIQLHKPEQKNLEWLYSISALCKSPNTVEFLQDTLQRDVDIPLKLSNLLDISPWQLIEAFVKAGANCDENGLLDKAVKGYHSKVVQLIIDKVSFYNGTVIHDAMESGNTEAVRILAGRVGLESRDKNGDTPLLAAINTGNVELVKIVLDHKVDIHNRNSLGQNNMGIGGQHTPLIRAAVKGNHEIVRLLINAGATIDTESSEWHLLVQDLERQDKNSTIEFIGNIMERRAKAVGNDHSAAVPTSNNGGKNEKSTEATSLCAAIRNGQSDLVQKLIDDGANVDESVYNEYLPLHWAVIIGNVRTIKILLKAGTNINAKGTNGRTPLFECVKESLVDIVQLLVEKGADVNARTEHGFAPIYYANDRKIAEILIAYGADVNVKSANGRTPLFVCVDKSLVDMVQLLIEKGADVNARSQHGFAPIHFVNTREIAEILIDHGADVNIKSINGRTPMSECVEESLVDMVQFLVEKGADVNVRDKDGYTPIHYVKDREVAEFLIAHGADINTKNIYGETPLFVCVKESLIDIVQLLIEKGADVNAKDEDNYTPIHIAKNREIIEILISHGADVNVKSVDGVTPLFRCVEESLIDIVQLLIEKGADVNAITEHGFTSIHSVRSKKIAEILIASGADVNVKNNDGSTLYDILLNEQNRNLDSTRYKRKEVSELLEYLKDLK